MALQCRHISSHVSTGLKCSQIIYAVSGLAHLCNYLGYGYTFLEKIEEEMKEISELNRKGYEGGWDMDNNFGSLGTLLLYVDKCVGKEKNHRALDFKIKG